MGMIEPPFEKQKGISKLIPSAFQAVHLFHNQPALIIASYHIPCKRRKKFEGFFQESVGVHNMNDLNIGLYKINKKRLFSKRLLL
ncbi:hypothetical protein [Fictibacillus sp. KU28468]|uniref:hypothetical protein n=1 Tax=Fictibacillus sp. KU28468 TaxID=2991053 RepID=UPI00223D4E64|nr:hypothetical protein [Fictibacillus sp. KU28468]UZJ79933.1 hypothetical protein OKX00_05515 [Fictibacillus sp. KU28468]